MKILLVLTLTHSSLLLAQDTFAPANPVNNWFIRQTLMSPKAVAPITRKVPGTRSFEKRWLEQSSEAQSQFIVNTQVETANNLPKDSEAQIYAFLSSKYSTDKSERQTVEVSTGRMIKLVDLGLGKNSVVTDNDKIIFDTKNYPTKLTYIHGLFPSPSNRYIAIVFGFDGSIDNQQVQIYDTQTSSMKHEFSVFAPGDSISWIDETTVVFDHPDLSSKGAAVVYFNIDTGTQKTLPQAGTLSIGDWNGHIDYTNNDVELISQKTQTKLQYKNLVINSFSDEDENYFYLVSSYEKETSGAIFRLAKKSYSKLELLIPSSHRFVKNVAVLNKYLGVQSVYDGDEKLLVYTLSGQLIGEATAPLSTKISSFSWNTEKSLINITLSSTANKKGKGFEWNPTEKFVGEDLLSGSDFEIETIIQYFESFDGEMIPARLTFKKGTVFDGARPVYMSSYGGFLLLGYLAPPTGTMDIEFLKRGGVLVGTGIRGGAERGYSWYEAASQQNKNVTSLDLIAVAKGLVQMGVTQSRKIISTGTSNGGYVVASAAMMSPESFGLVIPINGVHDQLDFSTLDRFGIGWEDDYSNPYKAVNFTPIVNRSALELSPPADSVPEFLIINGQQDTRVNKFHSYKLKSVLDDLAPGKALLMSVDHAGHWPLTYFMLGDSSLKNSSKVWSKIFDFSGMKF